MAPNDNDDRYTSEQRLINGYCYEHKAWVKDGKYIRCGHPDWMQCHCYGRLHEGEETIFVRRVG